MPETNEQRVQAILRDAGRPLKVSDFAKYGINRLALHRLEKSGVIERAGAGIYRMPETAGPYADWAALALRYPQSVICTLSAASFHGTTQVMPASIHVAFPGETRGSHACSSFPVGVEIHRWKVRRNPELFNLGVETYTIENVPVRITDPERTLADIFRFSSANPSMNPEAVHADHETFLDTLRRTVSRPDFDVSKLDRYIDMLGVGRAFDPYLRTVFFTMAEVPV